MTECGREKEGWEYKRTSNDFRFRLLEQNNCVCSICHGSGAKIEFEYITRDYGSTRKEGKICQNLQAHKHSFWICPTCYENLTKQFFKFITKGRE